MPSLVGSEMCIRDSRHPLRILLQLADLPLTVNLSGRQIHAPTERQDRQPRKQLSLIHISEPTRLGMISYAVFCLKKKKEKISTNPASIVDMPKIHEKEIVRLDADEVGNLLDEVETGDKLTDNQKYFHEKTKIRDVAILTLMLGTGIRVSECVGIDIGDVDFKNSGIKIRRKGGNETVVYFGREVEEALLDYIEERKHIIAVTGHENALFLSLQKKRMSVRSVEKLVKKYSSLITNLKKITPHKLRSTYGTSLYKETGDIYLVADVLGHKDVNTTRKHYAAIEDERRRKARNAVKLRKD